MRVQYKFKYKRFFFWRTIKGVTGHNLDSDLDRMDVFIGGKGIMSISPWSKYDMYLGEDFLLAEKDRMETEAGQPIKAKGVK